MASRRAVGCLRHGHVRPAGQIHCTHVARWAYRSLTLSSSSGRQALQSFQRCTVFKPDAPLVRSLATSSRSHDDAWHLDEGEPMSSVSSLPEKGPADQRESSVSTNAPGDTASAGGQEQSYVARGAAFEQRIASHLNSIGMRVDVVGGRGDKGRDITGSWLARPRTRTKPHADSGSPVDDRSSPDDADVVFRVVGQCKTGSRPLGPAVVREFESVVAREQDHSETLGVLATNMPLSRAAEQHWHTSVQAMLHVRELNSDGNVPQDDSTCAAYRIRANLRALAVLDGVQFGVSWTRNPDGSRSHSLVFPRSNQHNTT